MSPEHAAAEQLTLRLHELIRNGQDDDVETDSVREQLVETLARVPSEDRSLLNDLSGDLFMLNGEEILVNPAGHEALELRAAWEQRDWRKVRALLVYNISHVTNDYRAYARGRAWGELGYHRAAAEFLFYAWRVRPEKDNYAYLAVQALLNANTYPEALGRAVEIEGSGEASATLLYNLAHVLYDGARRCDGPFAARLYTRVVEIVDKASALPQPVVNSLQIAALVNKAFAQSYLEAPANAEATLTKALALDPSNDIVLSARGLVRMEASRQSDALLDFQRAVDAGTLVTWPFIYLAEHAMQSHDFATALPLIDQSLRRNPEERIRANLLEWRAIAMQSLGRVNEAVQAAYEAQALEPFNERIAENVDMIRKAQPVERMRVVVDVSPSAMRKTG